MPPQRRGAAGESRVAELTLDAKGTLTDSTIMGGRLPRLAYETHLAGGALNILADGRFEGFDPSTLVNRKEVAGTVTGTLKVNVQLADITAPVTQESIAAEGTVALEKSTVGGLAIDDASVEGKYAAQVADLKRLQVNGPDVKVDASGRMALDRTSESNLEYHVEAIDLAELASLAGQTGVEGSAVLDGTVAGNAASLQTTGTLDGSNVGYRENKALDLDSKYTVTVPDLNVKQIRVEADTNASFIKAGALQLNAVTAKTTYSGDRLQFTTNVKDEKRELDASGELILHTDHQEVHLPQLAVRTQGIEWKSVTGSEATIQYGQGRVQVDNLRLASGDQALTVNGAFAMQGESPAGAVKVQAANVDLQQLQTLLLTDRGLSGKLSAAATISGTAKAPVVDGHLEVVNGAFQSYKYQSLTADLDYTGDRIGVDATLQQSPTEAITAKGSVPMTLFKPGTGEHVDESAKDTVDLRVKSTALNLGIVQGFTTQVTDVSGTLEADVHVTGSGQDPHLQGFVDIKNGTFSVPTGGVSYSGLNTRIDLEPDKVRLQKFAILDEHGQPLNVSGELAVHARQVGAVNIAIDSDNFEVIDNELGDVGIDSKLTVTGELRRPQVRGTIRLEAARLEVDRILQLFYDPYSVEGLPPVVSAERTAESAGSAQEATAAALKKAETTAAVPGTRAQAEAGTVPAPGGAFAPVELDLRLEIPDNLVLRGRKLRPGGPTAASLGDMNITVGGDLQVVKAANDQVLLLGTIETVRGTYEFQGRRFDLQRGGTLRFLGEPQPNPALDVSATRTIPNTGVEARVRIQGTAKAPQLDADEQSAARGVRHPCADRLQPPRQRAGHWREGLTCGDGRRHCHRLHRGAAGRVDRPCARSRSLRNHHDHRRGRSRGRADRGSADRRQGVLQDAPAVRRPQHHRVPARIPARRFPASADHRGAGIVRLGQPHRAAAHRARGDRFDFLFQLLIAISEGSVGISLLLAGPHPRELAWGPTPTRRPASGRLLLSANLFGDNSPGRRGAAASPKGVARSALARGGGAPRASIKADSAAGISSLLSNASPATRPRPVHR